MLQRVKCTREKANKCSKFENCNCENLFFRTVEWSSRQRHSPRGLRVVDVGLVACHRARIGVLQTWVAVKCKRTTHMTVSSACDLLFDVRASIVLPRVLVNWLPSAIYRIDPLIKSCTRSPYHSGAPQRIDGRTASDRFLLGCWWCLWQ